MKKYNIIELDQPNIILASCPTLERASLYLQDIIKTDIELQKFYNWEKIPTYTIIETTEEDGN